MLSAHSYWGGFQGPEPVLVYTRVMYVGGATGLALLGGRAEAQVSSQAVLAHGARNHALLRPKSGRVCFTLLASAGSIPQGRDRGL